MICDKFSWNRPSSSGEEDFLNSSMYFCNFVVIYRWLGRALNLNKLESPSPKDSFWQSLVEIGPEVVNVLSQFRKYLPVEKGGALHFNKLESPSPKAVLCQVWLKLVQWFRRRRFLKFVNVISQFCNYLPLKQGGALHLNKFESPSP